MLIIVQQIKTALISIKSHKYPTSQSTGQVGWNCFYYLIITVLLQSSQEQVLTVLTDIKQIT